MSNSQVALELGVAVVGGVLICCVVSFIALAVMAGWFWIEERIAARRRTHAVSDAVAWHERYRDQPRRSSR